MTVDDAILYLCNRQSQARMAQIRQTVERLQKTSSIPWDEEEDEEEEEEEE